MDESSREVRRVEHVTIDIDEHSFGLPGWSCTVANAVAESIAKVDAGIAFR